jgi:predicted lipid-binding transport protein (Tim44 family)
MAVAAEPDWGIFEGRTGSLLHPIMMGGLFLYSAYTAFLGFQYRRQRTIGDEISALKKTIPAAATDAEGNELPPSPAVVQAQEQIASLTAERKDLSQKAPRDQHFAQGALLAFLGTAFAIEVRLHYSLSPRVKNTFQHSHSIYIACVCVLYRSFVFTTQYKLYCSTTGST